MKYLLIILIFIGCKQQQDGIPVTTNNATNAGATTECDSLRIVIDSLQKKAFIANYKLERVRYYVNIVNKNPSQGKYLRGWIIRAMDEK